MSKWLLNVSVLAIGAGFAYNYVTEIRGIPNEHFSCVKSKMHGRGYSVDSYVSQFGKTYIHSVGPTTNMFGKKAEVPDREKFVKDAEIESFRALAECIRNSER